MSFCIWKQTRHRLILNVNLDMIIYNNSNLELPPKELGKCTDWRFEISPDEKTALFRAAWDKRRIIGVDLNIIENHINHCLKGI